MSSMPGPLAGLSIVVTRPQAQSAALAEAIAAAGGVPLVLPLLEISAIADVQPLQQAASSLARYALAVFISPNAVEYSLPTLLAGAVWPKTLRPVAIGQGTVKILATHGISGCVAPQNTFDSESLLTLPELQETAVRDKRIVILRGDGGRELLADTLRARGAKVDCVSCYRRSAPAAGFVPWLQAWQAGELDAVTVSSSEGLRYLLAGLDAEGRDYLQRTPIFVPHARIAESAHAAGLQQVVLTNPADAGILEGLCAYNWSRS